MIYKQGRWNNFDIWEACLTSAEGLSVKRKSMRGGAPVVGGGGGGGGGAFAVSSSH